MGQTVPTAPGAGCRGRRSDATGKLVTPGFVDIHTHYDGQATWDDLLEPSSQHGVTTLVTGNCGVGIAPVLADDLSGSADRCPTATGATLALWTLERRRGA